MAFRVFFIDSGGNIHKISQKSFQDLIWCKPEVKLPQFANQSIRCAVIWGAFTGRSSPEIHKIDCSIHQFDRFGRFDERFLSDSMGLVAEAISFGGRAGHAEHRRRFRKRTMEAKFSWKPDDLLVARLIEHLSPKQICSPRTVRRSTKKVISIETARKKK